MTTTNRTMNRAAATAGSRRRSGGRVAGGLSRVKETLDTEDCNKLPEALAVLDAK